MKYEFIKNGMDDYTLKYKDKELKFNSKVDFVNRIQEATRTARIKMITDLAKQGLSIKSLEIEKKENGKTYIDSSSKEYMEQDYINTETSLAFDNIIKEMFNMSTQELLDDIGITSQDEAYEFTLKLGEIITGKTPIKQKNE
jgi:hypothetical protein